MARPSAGSMTVGDCRNADGPHGPESSSIIHENPAEPVPYIGSLRANDWSLHGARSRVIRRPAPRTGPGPPHHDCLAQESANQHLAVGGVQAGQSGGIHDAPTLQ